MVDGVDYEDLIIVSCNIKSSKRLAPMQPVEPPAQYQPFALVLTESIGLQPANAGYFKWFEVNLKGRILSRQLPGKAGKKQK